MKIYRFVYLILCASGILNFAHATNNSIITIWGTPELKIQCDKWIHTYSDTNPEQKFTLHFTGSDTAMAALYSTKCDIALISREATAPEVKAFEWIYRYKPLAIELLRVGEAPNGYAPSLGVYVNIKNKITELSLDDLEWILKKDPSLTNKLWSHFNNTDQNELSDIHSYIPNTDEGTGRYIRDAILHGNNSFDWENITEISFKDIHSPATTILNEVASQFGGLGIAPVGLKVANTKEINISYSHKTQAFAANEQTIKSKQYPLTRCVDAYINKKPGTDLKPSVKHFLNFILSDQGQEALIKESGYIKLNSNDQRAELIKLN